MHLERAAPFALAAALVAAVAEPAAPREVRLDGYAEWREGDALVVDGQRVRLGPGARLSLKGEARDWSSIPFGYEVRATGTRASDGSVLATRLEARPNGSALFESQVVALTTEAEEKFRRAGQFYQDDEGRVRVVGRLLESGPRVDRVRGIVDDVLPSYVDPESVRVYVIENEEWNAFAMGNYSVYVFTGLLDALDDDELAVVVGHELAHATHEHTRRQFRKTMWVQFAALGASLAAEEIDNKYHRAVASLLVQFGALAWANGYGRDLEDQADRVGLRYAWEAGYDVSKGPALWERFARRYGNGNRAVTFFLADHSHSRVRAENLRRELAANYPRGPKPDGRAYAAGGGTARRGGGTRSSSPPDPLATSASPRLRVGMSPDDVRGVLGAPEEEIVFGRRVRWVYPDATLVFESGRLTEVRF